MKYQTNLFNNSILYIFILVIFFNSFHNSVSTIYTGNYPLIKRLLNGNYIILSDTNITFTDGAIETELNTYNFGYNIYNNNPNLIASTLVSQFKSKDSGYIIAILNQKLFIFSSDGVYQTETTISLINAKFPCSVIPNSHTGNNYYFTLIFGHLIDEANEECDTLEFIKGIYDSSLKNIIFNDPISFNPSDYLFIYGSIRTFKAIISCDIMRNNSQEYIACLYGNYQNFIVSIFDFDNYELIASQNNNIGGHYFKSVILPDEKEKGIFCSFKAGQNLVCFNYDIKLINILIKQ